MNIEEVHEMIMHELHRSYKEHPLWPLDPIHAAAILTKKTGELVKAALDWMYHSDDLRRDWDQMAHEAASCAAMGLRFLLESEKYWGQKPEA
jgi:hypothetical protein